ncbi:GNAT family N-acetyltransferase [Ideonella sp. DXS29W]|uniref:GNAT family N-acetyltransferase n=1 Tax=Ideonella lacteola TaxID=2984193 RepID=A0ABU9BWU6_9BURK
MLKQVPEVIVGAQWRLRRSTVADAQAVFDVAHDPEVMRYMDWPAHRSVADARAYLEGVAGRWVAGSEYHWVIEPRSGGPLVGCIATRVQGHAADFGYFVARAAWGQGVATAAGRLLVDWLERQPSVLRIWATTDADNLASARVLEKLGLQKEGVLRLATWRPNLGGRPRDTAIYARCKSTT